MDSPSDAAARPDTAGASQSPAAPALLDESALKPPSSAAPAPSRAPRQAATTAVPPSSAVRDTGNAAVGNLGRVTQRWLVLAFSASVTALLAGVATGVWWQSSKERQQLSDVSFLERQLKSLQPATNGVTEAIPAASVRVIEARRQTIVPTRPLYGRLVEYKKVTVSSEVEGKVLEMPVEEGTLVKGGETLLASLDEVWSRLAIQQTEAEIASIEANLAQEDQELSRLRQLAEASSITMSDLESQDSLVRQLRANLRRAQALLAEKTERLNRAKLIAPFDGTVVAKHAEVGQILSVGSPLVDIVSRGRIDAEIRVPETLIEWVHVGMELPVTIQPLQLEQNGPVVSIVPYGPTASRTFPVRVRLDDHGGRLKVGMSVEALVPEGAQTDELFVDKSAVLVRPDGCVAWVVVADKSSAAEGGTVKPSLCAQPVSVKITARKPDGYAIRPEAPVDAALLVPGARLVVEGAERLQAGQSVRIVTLDQRHLEHLPKASGHEVIE